MTREKFEEGLSHRNGEDITILVVEDEDCVLKLLEMILNSVCLHVLKAKDGRQAVALIRDYGSAIHLLLADIVLPYVNGIEVLQEYRKKYPGHPVLFMTGWPVLGTDEYPIQLPQGATVIQKPFTQDDLLRKVRLMLNEAIPKKPA